MMRLRSVLPARGIWLLYIAVMALGILLFAPQKLSTNLLGIFPKNSYTQQLHDASSLQSLNPLLIVSKGFDEASRERIAGIAKALEGTEYVSKITYRSNSSDPKLTAALQEGYLQRAQLQEIPLDPASVRQKLEALYARMSNAFLFVPLNSSDPLGLFKDPLRSAAPPSRGGYMILPEQGYLLAATLNAAVADAEASQRLYGEVHAITDPYGDDVAAFAPHFFTAENSAKIKAEVNLIITATLVLLLLFYAVALRNLRVLLITSTVLAGSLFVGLSAVTACFDEVSIFTLAFGSGIVMMAVDYFFHYYFHGYYGRKGGNRSKVLAAFMTTAAGFAILFFAAFPLIQQLSLFAVTALAFAYFQFTFLIERVPLVPKETRLKMPAPSKGWFKPLHVTLFSFALLAVAGTQLRFDAELRRLDYRNDALLQLQQTFSATAATQKPLLIYGGSLDAVISEAEHLRSGYPSLRSAADLYRSQAAFKTYETQLKKIDFAKLRSELETDAVSVGFREGMFQDAYRFAQTPRYRDPDPSLLMQMGFETREVRPGRWVSIAYLDTREAAAFEPTKNAVMLQSGRLLEKSVEGVTTQLLLIGGLTLGVIVIFLIWLLRGETLRALNYILFPMAAILGLLALGTPLSLMHLFALIIVIVAGIDYGIYMSRPEYETDEAIYYAMLTTFAGFGIFVFSHIGALHHIGTVIATGIAATFILQRFQLRKG